jgi:enoyl-CoA hydratase
MQMQVTSGGGDSDARLVLVEFPARRRGTGAAVAGVAGAASAGAASPGDPGEPIPGVALLTLNRRRALNALSFTLLTELADAAEALDADPDVRAVVITGTGSRAFAAGADVAELSEQTPATLLESPGFRGWDRVAAVGVPTIAAVRGFALGGGAELAMACDMIIAGSDAVFGQPEIKLGVIPGAGGTQRLTRAIGQARAMELILTGRQVAADEAERLGFVTRVVPAEETLATALGLAAAIAALPAGAVRAAKAAVRAAAETPLAAGIDRERGLFTGLFGTPDQAEGMAAFLGKREPRWSHDR